MSYSLATLWHERRRYLPGILAVTFSALLIFFQGGLVVGQFSLTSTPIDYSKADIWVGHPMNLSVDLGRPIPQHWRSQVADQPGVERTEMYIIGLIVVDKSDGRSELCTIIGSEMTDNSLGAIEQLTKELRDRLTEPGSVVADEAELGRLGFKEIGDSAEVMGRRVRLVGVVRGLRSLAAPYLFCSLQTSRMLFQGIEEDQTIFILARCPDQKQAATGVQRLRHDCELTANTREEFSARTRLHWVTATKAGVATLWSAVLGLLVGLAITSQTLYAATAASRREYAVLDALGIPTWRMATSVLTQSFLLGTLGLALALPAAFGLAHLFGSLGVKMLLPFWLVAPAMGVTLLVVLLSGLFALRSLRLIEPAQLLR